MTDPWTTPAEPGARTRHFCPLCDWHLDTPAPAPFPAVTREWLTEARARHPEHADDPVFLAALAHLEPIDAAIRAHLQAHGRDEWLAATATLATLRGLGTTRAVGGYTAPDPERLLDALALGVLTDADVAWIGFAQQAMGTLALAARSPRQLVEQLRALWPGSVPDG